MAGFTFAPDPEPRGRSYFEGVPEVHPQYRQQLNWKTPSDLYDAVTSPFAEAILDEALKSKSARQATLFLQHGVGSIYHSSPTAKVFINKGAAAISHVSKIVRTHGISTAGLMVVNQGRVLYQYTKGEIDGDEALERALSEVVGMGGDMTGWMIAGSIAGAVTCPPWGAVVLTMVGAALGREAFKGICRAVRG